MSSDKAVNTIKNVNEYHSDFFPYRCMKLIK